MFNDRPVPEIAQIIFRMHQDKQPSREALDIKRKLDEREYLNQLERIDNDEEVFTGSMFDRVYFPQLRD